MLYRSAGNVAMVVAGIAFAAFLAQPVSDQLAILRTLPIPAPVVPLLVSAAGIAAAELQRKRTAGLDQPATRSNELDPAYPLTFTDGAAMNLANLSGILSRLISTAAVATTPTAQGGMGLGGSKDAQRVQTAAILWALVEQVLIAHPAAIQAQATPPAVDETAAARAAGAPPVAAVAVAA